MTKENDVNKNLPKAISLTQAAPLKSQKASLVTADEVDKVRGRVLETVKENLPNVRGVLNGKLRWTNQQVKLFQIMLNKVLPDLSASMNEHIHKNRTVDQLTRAELEAIVATAKKATKAEEADGDILDAEYTEEDISTEEVLKQFNETPSDPANG